MRYFLLLLSSVLILPLQSACNTPDPLSSAITSLNPISNPAPLTLSSIVPPRTGPGAKIKLIGTGFQSGATVKVGGLDAQVLSISATEIQAKTPDLPVGDAAVLVTNPDLVTAQLPSTALHVSWVTSVSSSYTHTCAVLNNEIQCWGHNTFGELGNGASLNQSVQANAPPVIQSTPVKVVGITGTITAVSAGYTHTCAIVNGGAKCWGSNGIGELGNNPTNFINLSSPVDVAGLGSGVTSISAGYHQTCAIANGQGFCWGSGNSGGLGTGNDDPSYIPAAVLGLETGVTALKTSKTGSAFTCGIKAGAVYCWGSNGNGGLGDGTTITIVTPIEVPGTQISNTAILVPALSSGATDLFMGNNNACVKVNGAIKCWGFNAYYHLANSTDLETYIPKLASALPSIPSWISMSTSTAPCGLFGGGVKCWGPNGNGGLGSSSPNTTIAQTPVDVTGLGSNVQFIDSGEGPTCAIKNGGLYCWGNGSTGALGNGSTTDAFSPVVPDLIW